ncbi:Uncharacterized protein AC502_0140 [Pseudomonas syringae pv. maculicola]|uniref:integrase n=1 Tax=Pseudomonas syringae group genomosp. 3 TaxID=251701 RepID=UPI000621736A|nr:integrase [Pseudomonas syringae group genomosp. 3]KKI25179.1 integrase [Pseudomonas syringae pv. persicae]KPB95627.1 Uncharacterized protein AC502_0140 [Pseudomonas syringae pv. maculicola]
MSENISEALLWPTITAQPGDVRELSDSARDKLIVSAIKVDGHWVIRSRYGDNIWQLDGLPNNVSRSNREIDFDSLPLTFRPVMKAILYRYIRRGRRESVLPKGAIIRGLVVNARPFLRHLETLKIDHLGAVTPMIAATYVSACRNQKQSQKSGKPLSQSTLQRRFSTVEALYELSQYTGDRIPQHPWPETSARAMAGRLGNVDGGKTPLIPDAAFCTLFEKAYRELEGGKRLLDLRDDLEAIAAQSKVQKTFDTIRSKNQHLNRMGWEGGLGALKKSLTTLRTACYVILASTSGCRNHELANLQSGAHHRTEDDEGTIYHWMRSTSEKTDEGLHDWMIPEAAVRALRIMERWSLPYQAMISKEIALRRRLDSQDPQIAEAYKHRHSLFLGAEYQVGTVRTLSNTSWGGILKAFAKDCGLDWKLASHQFRRKFANYAAHSRFGDLRYLKEHYAHWSLDMTLGYAMDDSWGQHLDLELYTEIQDEMEDIKLGVVDNWMGDKPLAGGYGRAINRWQREPQNLLIFKDRASMLKSISDSTAIRSNGNAWCTADNDGCVGNTLERTRCGGCEHSVIGSSHGPIYQRLYDDLKELLHCKDIGEGGRKRVERDLNRCRDVLVQLGMPSEALTA